MGEGEDIMTQREAMYKALDMLIQERIEAIKTARRALLFSSKALANIEMLDRQIDELSAAIVALNEGDAVK